MKKNFKNFKKWCRTLLPDKVLHTINTVQQRRKYGRHQDGLISYLKKQDAANMLNNDQKEILKNISSRPLIPFPYDFYYDIIAQDVVMYTDNEKQLPYFLFKGKKLYFPREMVRYDAKELYKSLIAEQDPQSPHCYFNGKHVPTAADTVLDLGAAEGIFGLSVVDHVKKLILVDADPKWKDALQATFEPYKDKVVILNKFVGSGTPEESISLDELYSRYGDISYIKMDIEGAERNMLAQVARLDPAKLQQLTLSVCTYHYQDDAVMIKKDLENMGFETEFSNGYVFFFYDENIRSPYLRKALIKGFRTAV